MSLNPSPTQALRLRLLRTSPTHSESCKSSGNNLGSMGDGPGLGRWRSGKDLEGPPIMSGEDEAEAEAEEFLATTSGGALG